MAAPTLHAQPFAMLDSRTFHDIVRLRVDTFIVEQHCPYPELDGRDTLPSTQHVWIEQEGEVLAYLRMYPGDAGVTWIGRVVTARAHRGGGLGSRLMRAALARATPPVCISAQTQLASWYTGLGFERCGPDFIEDGIPHTPMLFGA